MKNQVNVTSTKWAKEISEALSFVYSGHDNPGQARTGYSITFQKAGQPEYEMVGLGKYQEIENDNRYIPDAIAGLIDYDDNLAAICIVDGVRQRFKIDSEDIVFLSSP